MDAKGMTAGAEGSAADAAFQALVEFVTSLEQPEAKRRCMADLERVRDLLRSMEFLEAVVNGFVDVDANLSGRLTLDEFAPVAAAAVSAHFDELISVSTLCRLFDAFDAVEGCAS